MGRVYHWSPHTFTTWSRDTKGKQTRSSSFSLSGSRPSLQSPSCTYRFLISSKAKWSTPTDIVLMTLRLAPVGQKKPYLYLSSWDSRPSHIYRRVQRREGPAKGHKPSLNRAGQGPRALALLHTMVFVLLRPPSGDSQPAEGQSVCPVELWSRTTVNASELSEPAEDLLGNQQQQPKTPGDPPQARTAHAPAASRSFLSMRSERRQSRPWAPAIPCSRSSLGMGSSESHCSTSQLKTKERPLRGGGAPQVPTGPQSPQTTPTAPVSGKHCFLLALASSCLGLAEGSQGRVWAASELSREGG